MRFSIVDHHAVVPTTALFAGDVIVADVDVVGL